MATEADALHAAANSLNIRYRLEGGLLNFFEMPPLGRPTLPELLLAQTGLRSWFWASVVVGAGLYGVFLILAVLDGNTLQALIQAGTWAWRNSLLLPVMVIYLLLIQPPLRRLLINAINSFLPLLPTAKRSEHLVSTAYFLNRWREWLAIIIGVICGWLLDPPLNKPFLAPKIYSLPYLWVFRKAWFQDRKLIEFAAFTHFFTIRDGLSSQLIVLNIVFWI